MDTAENRSSEEISSLLKDLLEVGERYVEGLEKDLSDSKKKIKVSDITDNQGHQYVNLVQQGGGVLGIALLGYTYVLERMGIRFLKLAGTSAGAINATMLATVRPADSHTIKSPIVLYYLAQKKLFSLVDGNDIAKWLLKTAINYKDYITCLLNSALFTLLSSLGMILISSLLLWNDEGKSIVGVFIGIILSFFLAVLIFSRGQISNGILKEYLLSPFFLKLFGIVAVVLGLTWWLTRLPYDCGYPVFLGLGPIGLLAIYAFTLVFNHRYLSFIQVVVSIILTVVLFNGIVNSYHYTWNLDYPLWLYTENNPVMPYRYLSIAGISLLLFFFLIIGSVSMFLLGRFNGSHFGINPGNAFRAWIDDLMKNGEVHDPEDTTKALQIKLDSGRIVDIFNSKNGVHSLRDLELKLNQIPQLTYTPDPTSKFILADHNILSGLDKYDPDDPSLAIITTEIVTENKIVFPKMWRLFYRDKDDLGPADFVRASMSIPFFFEAFRVTDIPKRSERPTEWMKYLRYDGNDIKDAVFVDGGSLSNFPINVFNPTKASTPRLPTLGVRLQDNDFADSKSVQSLGGIISSIINTMRAYYDKDFLITHPQYERCLADIDVRGINWLDFNLKPAEQVELFRRGAQGAKDFLLSFDWEQYKQEQEALNAGALSADIRLANDKQEVQKVYENVKSMRGI